VLLLVRAKGWVVVSVTTVGLLVREEVRGFGRLAMLPLLLLLLVVVLLVLLLVLLSAEVVVVATRMLLMLLMLRMLLLLMLLLKMPLLVLEVGLATRIVGEEGLHVVRPEHTKRHKETKEIAPLFVSKSSLVDVLSRGSKICLSQSTPIFFTQFAIIVAPRVSLTAL